MAERRRKKERWDTAKRLAALLASTFGLLLRLCPAASGRRVRRWLGTSMPWPFRGRAPGHPSQPRDPWSATSLLACGNF